MHKPVKSFTLESWFTWLIIKSLVMQNSSYNKVQPGVKFWIQFNSSWEIDYKIILQKPRIFTSVWLIPWLLVLYSVYTFSYRSHLPPVRCAICMARRAYQVNTDRYFPSVSPDHMLSDLPRKCLIINRIQ